MKIIELNEKLKKIKLLAMDIDGTLTDATLYYSENGEELKRFSTRDGMGITLLRKGGIEAAIITSETSPIVTARAKKLQIEHVYLGSRDKSNSLREISSKLGIDLEEIAYIGDDVNDYHALNLVGFSACPFNSVDAIRETVDYICNADGGKGAVREVCEMILTSQNKSLILQENW